MTRPDALTPFMRPAAVAQLGGFRPPEHPAASWAGAVKAALPGEDWPHHDGEPMLALLQINVEELPVVPPALDGIALITLFVGPRELPVEEPNGTNWALRTYRDAAALVPLDQPPPARAGDPKARKGEAGTYARLPIRWRAVEDYPSRDDWPFERLDEYDELSDDLGEDMPGPHPGIKVGGWPSTVQHEVEWGGRPEGVEFVLQVDSEERIGFAVGFGGVLYVGRSTAGGEEEWLVDWQSM